MCNRFLYKVFGMEKDGCAENIARAVEPYGVAYEDIPDTMDLFTGIPQMAPPNRRQ